MAFKHKVIVHVGLPKCGSSSLQDFLFDNRELLKQWKVYCPVTSPPKIGPVVVRESRRAKGPERILSDASETTHSRSGHCEAASCGCAAWQRREGA